MDEKIVLCDTNILINLFRYDDDDIKQRLIGKIPVISIISKFELLQGVKSKEDFQIITKSLKPFTILSLNNEISEIAETLFEKYLLSHHPTIPDTLITATALYYNIPFYTNNTKHFKHYADLQLL